MRKTPSLEAAIPWLYLKGISSGEMGAALEVLVGSQAKGLSAIAYLKDNDAYHFFKPLDDLVMTGPTGTNVADVAMVLVGVSN